MSIINEALKQLKENLEDWEIYDEQVFFPALEEASNKLGFKLEGESNGEFSEITTIFDADYAFEPLNIKNCEEKYKTKEELVKAILDYYNLDESLKEDWKEEEVILKSIGEELKNIFSAYDYEVDESGKDIIFKLNVGTGRTEDEVDYSKASGIKGCKWGEYDDHRGILNIYFENSILDESLKEHYYFSDEDSKLVEIGKFGNTVFKVIREKNRSNLDDDLIKTYESFAKILIKNFPTLFKNAKEYIIDNRTGKPDLIDGKKVIPHGSPAAPKGKKSSEITEDDIIMYSTLTFPDTNEKIVADGYEEVVSELSKDGWHYIPYSEYFKKENLSEDLNSDKIFALIECDWNDVQNLSDKEKLEIMGYDSLEEFIEDDFEEDEIEDRFNWYIQDYDTKDSLEQFGCEILDSFDDEGVLTQYFKVKLNKSDINSIRDLWFVSDFIEIDLEDLFKQSNINDLLHNF